MAEVLGVSPDRLKLEQIVHLASDETLEEGIKSSVRRNRAGLALAAAGAVLAVAGIISASRSEEPEQIIGGALIAAGGLAASFSGTVTSQSEGTMAIVMDRELERRRNALKPSQD